MRTILLLLPAFLFFLIADAGAQTQTFLSDGTFIVPAGVTLIQVECWGGGGRGGTKFQSPGVGGGGGGGAYSRKNPFTVNPGDTYAVFVGQGSNSGIVPGGDSEFYDNANMVLVRAKGGSSVPNNSLSGASGGSSSQGIGDVKYSGGNGADGLTGTYGGGGGSSAGISADGNDGSGYTGGNAPPGGGIGGNGATSPNEHGYAGSAPGGGGGGARTTGMGVVKIGGPGGNGQVIVSWGTALPVTWLSFRAALNEANGVDLFWSTASESNNEGFDVERSANGRDWQTIGFVAGAGTTSEIQNYSFTDDSPATGDNYYRLKQKDYDGGFEYSPIRVVEVLGDQSGIRVYPNPASEMVTISFAAPTEMRGTVQLYTQNNRFITEYAIPPQTVDYQLRVSTLPSGTYILVVKVGNEEWSKRIVVE